MAEKTSASVRRAVRGPTAATAIAGGEELLTLGRDNVAGLARAGQAVLTGTSELGRVWTGFWSEQIEAGVAALRALGHCRTWGETLETQIEFARTSLERTCARAAESVEVTAGVIADGLKPPRENARGTAERAPRAVA